MCADGPSFSIHDSGPGMTSKSAPQVFSPFHLLHNPHAPYGYGPAIIRRLTELQGGRCGCHPERKAAKTFHFTLPDEGSD